MDAPSATATAIERTPVVSSQVKSVGHDPDSNELHVEFRDGSVWAYGNVDAEGHAALLRSESLGKHLHQVVKSNPAKHPARLVSARPTVAGLA